MCVSPRDPVLVASVIYWGFIKLRNGMRYNKMAANLELPRGAGQNEANLRTRLVYNRVVDPYANRQRDDSLSWIMLLL